MMTLDVFLMKVIEKEAVVVIIAIAIAKIIATVMAKLSPKMSPSPPAIIFEKIAKDGCCKLNLG